MTKGSSDMSIGDTFDIEYDGREFVIEYCVQRGLYAGDGDRYYFKASMKDGDGEARASFHFWRSHTRVAKIAAKRAIKDQKEKQQPSTAERIREKLGN